MSVTTIYEEDFIIEPGAPCKLVNDKIGYVVCEGSLTYCQWYLEEYLNELEKDDSFRVIRRNTK